ncbi:hypothetical protein Pan181_42330 [Aeoliella mucimassa]|uniref:Uncharacterized protein n=2 Tax=Aeoliella mucimassa TaxID=2527972 RepID=A0A518ATF6_9BACT|nr:hypothetical protein Pan181_42330 [Aeoliella mucimassa]
MEHHELIAASLEELQIKTETHDRLWHLTESEWGVDQDEGVLEFATPAGLIVTCKVQIIGTYDTTNSTWLWSWDNRSIEPALTEDASKLREYGQAHDLEELTTRKLDITEEKCWEFTALACKLCEAQGGYRGPAGTTMVFMTFGEPRLEASPIAPDDVPPAQ